MLYHYKSTYMEEKLWSRMGVESDAYWLLDKEGMELVFGGLNAVLRDYARFGLLYMNNGVYKGEEVVPSKWVHDSVTPDAPHLAPGRKEAGQEYMAMAISGGFPREPMVISWRLESTTSTSG